MTDQPADLSSDDLAQLAADLENKAEAISELNETVSVLTERAERAESAIKRVRALHRRNENTGDCEHCSAGDYPDYSVPHPCPTIRALEEPARTTPNNPTTSKD